MFRGLIRYFFNEWDYNGHLGGSSIIELLSRENEILRTEHLHHDALLELDEAVALLTSPGYEEEGTPISLYAGYHEGEQITPLVAVKNSFSDEWNVIGTRLERVNDFVLEDDVKGLVTGLLPRMRKLIVAGARYFRARIGYEKHAVSVEGAWEATLHYAGYTADLIGAPRPANAASGRMNRDGVAFLYLATDRSTAVAEVRPHADQMVTTAAFEATRDIIAADFHALDIGEFSTADAELDKFQLLHSLGTSFARPVPPDYRHRYRFTQLLADCIRREGFDAIMFNSGLGPGFNVAIFDPGQFRYVDGTSIVHRVVAVKYEDLPLPVLQPDGHYFAEIRPE